MERKNLFLVIFGMVVMLIFGTQIGNFYGKSHAEIKTVKVPVEKIVEKKVYLDIDGKKLPKQVIHLRSLIQENQELRKQQEEILSKNNGRIYIQQGIHAGQFKSLIRNIIANSEIVPSKEIDRYVELLLVTSQVESNMGFLTKQQGGPALGVFQMEPATEKDILENYIKPNKKLEQIFQNVKSKRKVDGVSELQYNFAYATLITVCAYKRYIDTGLINLPKLGDIDGQTYVWKKIYNSVKGKGTQARAKFNALALNEKLPRVPKNRRK